MDLPQPPAMTAKHTEMESDSAQRILTSCSAAGISANAMRSFSAGVSRRDPDTRQLCHGT